jgi:hypothetical protein
MSVDNISELLKVVDYNAFVTLASNKVADVSGYDFFICAGLNQFDESFSSEIINYFDIQNSAAFDANIITLPPNFNTKMIHYKRNVSNIKDAQNANLEYFINNYSNMFLKMNLNGNEYLWFSTLDVNKLSKFKQIVIQFNNNISIDSGTKLYAFGLINETHYIVDFIIDGDNINVVYIRKDYVSNPVFLSNDAPSSKLTIQIPEDSDININVSPIHVSTPIPIEEPAVVIEDAPAVVEEESVVVEDVPAVVEEEPAVVEEEPAVVDEEPAVVVEEEPAVVDEEPAVVEEEPTVVVDEEPAVVIEDAPAVVEEESVVVEDAPAVVEEEPAVVDEEPAVVVEEEPTVVVDEEPAVVVEEEPAAVVEEEPAVVEEEPTIVVEEEPAVVEESNEKSSQKNNRKRKNK